MGKASRNASSQQLLDAIAAEQERGARLQRSIAAHKDALAKMDDNVVLLVSAAKDLRSEALYSAAEAATFGLSVYYEALAKVGRAATLRRPMFAKVFAMREAPLERLVKQHAALVRTVGDGVLRPALDPSKAKKTEAARDLEKSQLALHAAIDLVMDETQRRTLHGAATYAGGALDCLLAVAKGDTVTFENRLPALRDFLQGALDVDDAMTDAYEFARWSPKAPGIRPPPGFAAVMRGALGPTQSVLMGIQALLCVRLALHAGELWMSAILIQRRQAVARATVSALERRLSDALRVSEARLASLQKRVQAAQAAPPTGLPLHVPRPSSLDGPGYPPLSNLPSPSAAFSRFRWAPAKGLTEKGKHRERERAAATQRARQQAAASATSGGESGPTYDWTAAESRMNNVMDSFRGFK